MITKIIKLKVWAQRNGPGYSILKDGSGQVMRLCDLRVTRWLGCKHEAPTGGVSTYTLEVEDDQQ